MLRPIREMTTSRFSSILVRALAPSLILVGACIAPVAQTGTVDAVESTSNAIYGGEIDNTTANNAVVALRVGDGSPFELCSGVLIAPNVVMTARHCISKNLTDSIDCDENGISHDGDQLGEDVVPRTIHVMLGANPDFNAKPSANGKLIFRPKGQSLCNADLAMVVLDREIASVAPMRIRLSEGVTKGETIRAVGYGHNDKKIGLGTRFRKDGITILTVGSTPRNGTTGRPAIAGSEFEVGKSICQGDSGGPAISEATGAVVGIVSRGVDCDLDFGHIYTRTAGFRTLFERTFAEAGGAVLEEKPRLEAVAAKATGDSETRSATETSRAAPTVTNLNATTATSKGCATAGFVTSSPSSSVPFSFGAALIALLGLTARRMRPMSRVVLERARPRV
jgi:hypothetical protein